MPNGKGRRPRAPRPAVVQPDVVSVAPTTEAHYRNFIHTSSEAIWRFELEQPIQTLVPPDIQVDHFFRYGYLAECNDLMARAYGYASAAAMQGVRLAELLPPTDPQNVAYLDAFVRSGYRLVDAESVERARDGSTRYFLNNLIGEVEDGMICRAWGTSRDVTERRRTEAALRDSESRFRTMADSAPVLLWMTDTSGSCTFLNQRWLDFTGRPLDEELGWGWLDNVHPDDRERCIAIFMDALERREPLEVQYRLQRADGAYRWLLDTGTPRLTSEGQFIGYIGSCIDITEQRQLEAALRQKTVEQDVLLNTIPALVFYKDRDSRYVAVNQTFAHAVQRSIGEISGASDFDLFPRDEAEGFRRHDAEVVATGRPKLQIEEPVTTGDGKQIWTATYKTPYFDANGAVAGLVGISIDITERKLAEQRLLAQNEVVETVNRIGQILAGELDLQRVVQAVTDAATELVGAQFGAFFYNAVNEQGEAYTLYTLSGAEREAFASFPMPRNTHVFGPTFRNEGIVRSSDITQDPRYGRNPPFSGMPPGHLPVKSYLAVPVVSRSGEVLGGIFLGHGDPGVFGERDEQIVVGLAAQAAIAADNARLYEAELQARRAAEAAVQRTARLQAVTAALGEALTPRQVAEVVVEQGISAMGAVAGVLALLTADRIELEIIRAVGYASESVNKYHRFPLAAPVPLAEAVRTGMAVWSESGEMTAKLFPAVAGDLRPSGGALLCIPLWSEGQPIGGLGLSFDERRHFSDDDKALMLAIARQCSQALERARLYEAERKARTAAEVAEREKEEARALLDALFASAPTGLAFFDRELRVQRVNDALAEINGLSIVEHLGRPVDQVMPYLSSLVQQDLQAVLETGQPIVSREVEGETPAAPGVKRFWLANFYQVPGPQGTPLGIGAVIQEITDRKRVDTALRHSEERYRSLVDATSQLVWTTDAHGRVDDMPMWRAFTGQSRDEVRGAGWLDALHPDDREPTARVWGDAVTRRTFYETEYRVRRLDGVYRVFLARGVPVLEPAGMIREWVGTCTDITERRRAETHQRFIADASALLAASLDYQTTLRSVAQFAVPRLADWCAVDIVDGEGVPRRLAMEHTDAHRLEVARRLHERYPSDPDAEGSIGSVLRTGRSVLVSELSEAVLVAVARNEEQLSLLRELGLKSYMIVPLVTGGRILGALTLANSDSGQRFDEIDLALAEEVARRAAVSVDNARLYHDAQQAILARDDFLSIASHELKTPLTSLQLQAQSLLRLVRRGGLASLTADRLASKLELIDGQTERLTALANDLLDVARIRAGRIDFRMEALDVAAVLANVAARFEEQIDQVGCKVTITSDGPVPLWSDRARLDQVITNLLSNAIKYSAGKPIELRAELDHDAVRLIVRDEGIGIAPEHLERIFVRFERAVSSRNYGGLGLGLYIVRQIVEALGGTIRVSSDLGAGSTFVVSLPRLGPPSSLEARGD